jgi:hypothetical protein
MQAPSFGQRRAELVGNLAPDLRCGGMVGLEEYLADGSGNDGILALGT